MPDVLEILQKLPKHAFINNRAPNGSRLVVDTDAPVINVSRGVPGYSPIYTPLTADELNGSIGVTAAQREAMLHGSMFGFHTPGADPDNHLPGGLMYRPKTETTISGG